MAKNATNQDGAAAQAAAAEPHDVRIARSLHILSALTRRVLEEDVEHERGTASFTQIMILKWIDTSGPRRNMDVARFLAASAPAATQILARLKQRGLLRSRPEAQDARVDRITITPRGKKLVAAYEKRKLSRLGTALEKLSPESRVRVTAGLEAAIELLLGAAPELIDLCLHCGAYASPKCLLRSHGLRCPTDPQPGQVKAPASRS